MKPITPEETKILFMLVLHYGSDWHDWTDKRYADKVSTFTYDRLFEAGYVEYQYDTPRNARVSPEGLSFLQEVETFNQGDHHGKQTI
jgi:hypothetical protein